MKKGAPPGPRRNYRQTARAAAAEATARRIAEAFSTCITERWFDEVTLEEVARLAGVTVRTVVRRFGSKDGLAQGFVQYIAPGIRDQRTAPRGDVQGAVERIVTLYEAMGDGVIRNLAQEPRQPALHTLLETGRRGHRQITADTYEPWLEQLASKDRQRMLDMLVIATDVYTWKLLRRDMGRSARETRTTMLDLVHAILGQSPAVTSPRRNS